MESPLERHLECCECKKPIAVCYTEVIGKMTYRVGMCSECPILRQKLYGHGISHGKESDANSTGLVCGQCGTTADEVKMGSLLGCKLCYEVFSDLIVIELESSDKFLQKKKSTTMHLGRSPGEISEVSPQAKLLSLHQALHETLTREDYEQAAWLRDQIKALSHEKKEKRDK
jgi:protein arginine kinase activator